MPSHTVEKRPSRTAREGNRFRREAKTLGAKIRALRIGKRMTLEDAAEAMDLDWKHLQKIEVSRSPINVTLVTLVRIADGLKVTISVLFSRDDE